MCSWGISVSILMPWNQSPPTPLVQLRSVSAWRGTDREEWTSCLVYRVADWEQDKYSLKDVLKNRLDARGRWTDNPSKDKPGNLNQGDNPWQHSYWNTQNLPETEHVQKLLEILVSVAFETHKVTVLVPHWGHTSLNNLLNPSREVTR